MRATYDVHLLHKTGEAHIETIDAALRARGLSPWYFERDIKGWNVFEVEQISIRSTPVCAVFLGPQGWGQYHAQYARMALDLERPIVPVLLPDYTDDCLAAENELFRDFKSSWVRMKSVDEAELNELAQRIVDAAYESRPAQRARSKGLNNSDGTELSETRRGALAAGRRLIVYVPARSQAPEDWHSLRTRLENEAGLQDSVWVPHHYDAGVWSGRGMEQFALDLKAVISGHLFKLNAEQPNRPIEHIMLMGHSFGGMLVRIAYLMAAGQYPEVDPRGSSWWKKVDRIVLFAAPNRGIESRRLSWRAHWRERVALHLPHSDDGPGRLMQDQLVGSAAVTNLRIRWIRFLASLEPKYRPNIVQFLGRGDGLVKREDSLDFDQFSETCQIDVPGASHTDVHQVPLDDDLRYYTLRAGILGTAPEFPVNDIPRNKRNPVVLVVHGIRASNETWAAQLKDLILSKAPSSTAIPPTYRYFPMLDFALPWLRARKVRWLQDQYSTLLARYPRARFNFVGHSNGTYLLGHSLKQVPAMTFDRVTLAGSVLPREYDWDSRFSLGQVGELANHRATRDLPVAILCNLLRAFGTKDVGTAGFDGFDQAREEIKEVYYYSGGHSKALETDNLPHLADFTLTGKIDFPLAKKEATPGKLASRLSGSSLVALLTAAALIAVVGLVIWGLSQLLLTTVVAPPAAAMAASAGVVLSIAYLISRYF